jgi:hypothetical protein
VCSTLSKSPVGLIDANPQRFQNSFFNRCHCGS